MFNLFNLKLVKFFYKDLKICEFSLCLSPNAIKSQMFNILCWLKLCGCNIIYMFFIVLFIHPVKMWIYLLNWTEVCITGHFGQYCSVQIYCPPQLFRLATDAGTVFRRLQPIVIWLGKALGKQYKYVFFFEVIRNKRLRCTS